MIAALFAVVCLGDSITAGAVSEPIGPNYATLIGCENAGVGGTTTRDWLPGNGIFEELPDARTVTILLGTNDATGFLEPEPVPVEEYEANLREITEALFDKGTQRVIVLTPPQAFYTLQVAVHNRLSGYRAAVWDICQGDVTCGPDVHELLQVEHFEDGDVHPNGSGHALIAELLPEPDSKLLAAVGLLTLAAVFYVKRMEK